MTREDADEWLSGTLAAPYFHAHIGYLSEHSCVIVIWKADKLLTWYRSKQQAHMD